MRTRSLILILLLYAALVWVWSARQYSGQQIVQNGLLWTGVGIGVVLAILLLERAWTLYRNWKARRAAVPPSIKQPIQPVHEDDRALAALWDEARANLTSSPEYGRRGRNLDLAGLPLFLIVGPSGTGKSSTLLNSGVDPQLLAGQTATDGKVAPTRVANIFIARDVLFAEVSGRIWEGDPKRWTEFLQGFADRPTGPWWRRLFHRAPQKPQVQGVVFFQDFSTFGQKVDPAKISRASQRDQERLLAIAAVFGIAMPVYAIFTKIDATSFFEDFFLRMPEAEYAQPLGMALPVESRGIVTADHVARQFTKAFNVVGSRLADRRVLHLARESDNVRKPGIYEFPREFRRGRSAFVQFLSEVFRPNPLKAGPFLCGFYFTGLRMIEAAPAGAPTVATGLTSAVSATGFKSGATTMFRVGATEIFRPSTPDIGTPAASHGLKPRWIFARQLFEELVPRGRRPQQLPKSITDHTDRIGQIVAAAITGIAVLACLIWLQSWWSNRALIADTAQVFQAAPILNRQPGGEISMPALQQLETLREQAVRLDETPPLRMRWGLYAGDSLRVPVRRIYFDRLNNVLLNDLNRYLIDKLGRLPQSVDAAAPFEPAYSELATHLKISSDSCQTSEAVVAASLKAAARQSGLATDGASQSLVDRQIDYYAASLKTGLPISLPENPAAVAHARKYLSQIESPERRYRAVREAVAAKNSPTLVLTETVPEYQQVLAGPSEIAGVFSPKGQSLFEQELKTPNRLAGSDACVLGSSRSFLRGSPELETNIRALYADDYKAAWKEFLSKFRVHRYAGLQDASRKLEILSGPRSPILGVLAFASNNTYYSDSAKPSDLGKGILDKAKALAGNKVDAVAEKVEKQRAGERKEPQQQVSESFQPVRAVVSPGSETWATESTKPYLNALAEFRLSLQAIGRSASSAPDPAVHQAALAARDKAFEVVRQMSLAFEPVGTDGIDAQVRDLLEQPIRNGSSFIIANPDKVAEGKLNGKLAGLCTLMMPVLSKYPFNREAKAEATLQDISNLFAPGSGAVWKYQQDSLAEFVVHQDNRWIRKPDVPKPRISDGVLEMLNRSQQVSSAFYGAGSSQLSLQYTLRPVPGTLPDQISLEFNFDGRAAAYSKGSALQKNFQWPPAAGSSHRAVANIVTGGFTYPFASGIGIWGVFRVFGDAEPRALGEKNVEWKYNRVAGGQPAPMNPPVRMQFVDFPGGIDLFNPAFFGGLQCPGRAVP